ncbi:polyprotein [Vaccinivirus cadovaccinii]|uniref:RNA-directed DNA polymerase n=1 Tax=Vaccinivirus cadovaccinii TaxID=3052813 RepID=A0A0S2A4A7_9VIRU|nr:polyprotein [Vaccinivirus cadovaccinii]ALN12435.1 polyprotein [Vaccinivirus cadovaccinii]
MSGFKLSSPSDEDLNRWLTDELDRVQNKIIGKVKDVDPDHVAMAEPGENHLRNGKVLIHQMNRMFATINTMFEKQLWFEQRQKVLFQNLWDFLNSYDENQKAQQKALKDSQDNIALATRNIARMLEQVKGIEEVINTVFQTIEGILNVNKQFMTAEKQREQILQSQLKQIKDQLAEPVVLSKPVSDPALEGHLKSINRGVKNLVERAELLIDYEELAAKIGKNISTQGIAVSERSKSFMSFDHPKPVESVLPKARMFSMFAGGKPKSSIVRSLELEVEEQPKVLKDYKVPKLSVKQLYEQGSMMQRNAYRIKQIERKIPYDPNTKVIHLVDKGEMDRMKAKGYEYVHFGAVQVVFRLLARRDLNCSVLSICRDNRLKSLQKGLLGALQASLNNQVAYFVCIPNFSCTIEDAHEALVLCVQTHGTDFKEGYTDLAIEYIVTYKFMTSDMEAMSKLKATEGFNSMVISDRNNHTISHTKKIDWKELNQSEFPKEWSINSEEPPEAKSSSVITGIYQHENGNISMRFHQAGEGSSHSKAQTHPVHIFDDEPIQLDVSKSGRPKARMIRASTRKEVVVELHDINSIREISDEKLDEIYATTSDPQYFNYTVLPEMQRRINQGISVRAISQSVNRPSTSGDSKEVPITSEVPSSSTLEGKGKTKKFTPAGSSIKLPLITGVPTGKPNEFNTERYKPRIEPNPAVSPNGVWLDIDNNPDPRGNIDEWVNTMNMLIVSETGKAWSPDEARTYYACTFKGIARKWFDKYKETDEYVLWLSTIERSKSPSDFATCLYKQFCREQDPSKKEKDLEILKGKLVNLTISDLKYFLSYVNEYNLAYYNLGIFNNNTYRDMFIQKLPDPWKEYLTNERAKEAGNEEWTLGNLIEFVKTKLADLAIQAWRAKRMQKLYSKSGLSFCQHLIDIPTQWGGRNKELKHKKKGKKIKSFKRYKFRKSKKKGFEKSKINPQKNFKRRFKQKSGKEIEDRKKQSKSKPTSSKGVANVCWNCNQQGHFSRECPRKNARLIELQEAADTWEIPLMRIEEDDDYSDTSSIYSLETESDSESSDSDQESEDEDTVRMIKTQFGIKTIRLNNWPHDTQEIGDVVSFEAILEYEKFECDFCKTSADQYTPVIQRSDLSKEGTISYHTWCFTSLVMRETKNAEVPQLVQREVDLAKLRDAKKKFEQAQLKEEQERLRATRRPVILEVYDDAEELEEMSKIGGHLEELSIKLRRPVAASPGATSSNPLEENVDTPKDLKGQILLCPIFKGPIPKRTEADWKREEEERNRKLVESYRKLKLFERYKEVRNEVLQQIPQHQIPINTIITVKSSPTEMLADIEKLMEEVKKLQQKESTPEDKPDATPEFRHKDNSIYISAAFRFKGYEEYHLHCLVDTGASITLATQWAIPEEKWITIPHGNEIKITVANGETCKIDKYATNVPIYISGIKFTIEKVLQFNKQGCDFLIGNDFFMKYAPYTQYPDRISIAKNGISYITNVVERPVSVAYRKEFLERRKIPDHQQSHKVKCGENYKVQKQAQENDFTIEDYGTTDSEAEEPIYDAIYDKGFQPIESDDEPNDEIQPINDEPNEEVRPGFQPIESNDEPNNEIQPSNDEPNKEVRPKPTKDIRPKPITEEDFQAELRLVEAHYEKQARPKQRPNLNVLEEQISRCSIEELTKQLEPNISDNPIHKWDVTQTYADIQLKDPYALIRVKPMPYSAEDEAEFERQLEEQLKLELIQPSKSPHSSPAFCVRNHAEIKRQKARIVINYKELNRVTKDDGYFLPNLETLVYQVAEARVFSKFDCKSGYWQIKLTPESIPLTAFSTPKGQYEWKVLPFGLKNAPNIFQRRMDKIFKDCYQFCGVYVDDILVFSKDKEEHLLHLDIIINKIVQNGIIIGRTKYELVRESIDFLGVTICKGKIKLQPHILTHLMEFPDKLKDRLQVQQFLGCVNYAGKFIQRLAELCSVLHTKLKKDHKWKFTEDDVKRVQLIKKVCANLPELTLPPPTWKIVLQTDASDHHWAGTIGAISPDKKEEVICAYRSGTFKPAEQNYSTQEKEVLAIIRTIQKAKIFVLKPFLVRTDSKFAALFLDKKINESLARGRLIRWQIMLRQYYLDIEHIPGVSNYLPNALTREMAGCNIIYQIKMVNHGKAPRMDLRDVITSKARARENQQLENEDIHWKQHLASTSRSFAKRKDVPMPSPIPPPFEYKTYRRLTEEQKSQLDWLTSSWHTVDQDTFFDVLKAMAKEFEGLNKLKNGNPAKRVKTSREAKLARWKAQPKKFTFFEEWRTILLRRLRNWTNGATIMDEELYQRIINTPCRAQLQWWSQLNKLWQYQPPEQSFICKATCFDNNHTMLKLKCPPINKLTPEFMDWFENGFIQSFALKRTSDYSLLPTDFIKVIEQIWAIKDIGNTLFIMMYSAPGEWNYKDCSYYYPYHLVRIYDRVPSVTRDTILEGEIFPHLRSQEQIQRDEEMGMYEPLYCPIDDWLSRDPRHVSKWRAFALMEIQDLINEDKGFLPRWHYIHSNQRFIFEVEGISMTRACESYSLFQSLSLKVPMNYDTQLEIDCIQTLDAAQSEDPCDEPYDESDSYWQDMDDETWHNIENMMEG